MEETLAKRSDFLRIKYKFFLNRILTYFSFLLIPIWIQHTLELNLFVQSIILLMYMFFMGGQWYLLGKEIDHRFKIYYRANSSLDRIVYRLFMGSFVMLLLFNIFSLFPAMIFKYIFWGFFILVGLFYSWPTRGKIIEDSMTNQLGEFRYLDSFERTILLLTGIMLVVSLPEIPLFQNIDALKLYFDPRENVNATYWNFLTITYYPFSIYPKLYNLIWSFHFYFFGVTLFLAAFYCILRYFYSRRLALLGVFSIVSSWSFSRILGADYFSSIVTTYSLLWVWTLLWSSRSGTYRSGLLVGFMCAFGVMLSGLNIFFLPLSLIAGYYFSFNKEHTLWFRKQWLKYTISGVIISLLVFSSTIEHLSLRIFEFEKSWALLKDHMYRKAFYSIAPIGVVLLGLYLLKIKTQLFVYLNFDRVKFKELTFGITSIFMLGFFVDPDFLDGFVMIWMLSFFSLLPLEWIFQAISRLRSKRNLIYVLYILVCLLDSHFENRLRIVAKMFLDSESYRYLIQL